MGFNAGKYAQNPYIKGEDLDEGERLIVTIQNAQEVTFPSGDTVPVLEFLETEQKLTLNKTRVRKLVELFGEDTDVWLNQKIALYPVPVQYNGKSSMGVAIAPVQRKVKAKAAPQDVQFMPEEEEAPF